MKNIKTIKLFIILSTILGYTMQLYCISPILIEGEEIQNRAQNIINHIAGEIPNNISQDITPEKKAKLNKLIKFTLDLHKLKNIQKDRVDRTYNSLKSQVKPKSPGLLSPRGKGGIQRGPLPRIWYEIEKVEPLIMSRDKTIRKSSYNFFLNNLYEKLIASAKDNNQLTLKNLRELRRVLA